MCRRFFFAPDENEKKNSDALAYFGNIKSIQARYVSGVQIYVPLLGYTLTIPVKNVKEAHYRTPDINGMINCNSTPHQRVL